MSSPPTTYVRQADFTGFSSAHPDEQQNGVDLDDEFNALKLTTDSLISRLGQVQRSDGLLTNQIVTPDNLSSNVLAFFTALGSAPRGNWLTGTAYVVRDLTVQGGAVYICALAHTSGVFATDLAAGKWQVLSNVAGNQSLNTTDNVQFANLTLTGAASFGSTLAVTGISTLTGYTKIGTANAATNGEKVRVGGDIFLEGGIQTANGRMLRNLKSNLSSGVAYNLFSVGAGSGEATFVRLRCWTYNSDSQPDYSSLYFEANMRIRDSAGTDQSASTTGVSYQDSINSGVILIAAMSLSLTRSGGVMTVSVTPSVTGSAGASKVTLYYEVEALGDRAASLALL